MGTKEPVLDDRKSMDIYRQSMMLARFYCPEWAEKWHTDFDPDDPGLVMLKLFSKMTEHLITQFNRIPEKHRIAFLDFMGIDLLPAQPAKVPVTFYLAEGASGAYVPKGAQVASKEPEVIFETTKGLSVAPAKLGGVFTLDPLKDSYADHSKDVKEKEDAFSIFGEKSEKNLDHVLYIGDDRLFDFRRPPKKLIITFEGSYLSKKYFHQFYYGNEKILNNVILNGNNSSINAEIKEIQSLKRSTIDNDNSFWLWIKPESSLKFLYPFYWDEIVKKDDERFKDFIINTNGPTWVGSARIEKINENEISVISSENEEYFILLRKTTVNGKVDIKVSSNDGWEGYFAVDTGEKDRLKLVPRLPEIDGIKVDVTVGNILPDMAIVNNTPVDMKKGFYIFGESPKAGDALYIGSDELFSKKGAKITLDIQFDLKDPAKIDKIDAELSWEYWEGTKWSLLGKSNKSNSESGVYKENNADIGIGFSDNTKAFTVKGPITFTRCPPIEKTEINGQSNRWIRVRIETGCYGEEGKFEQKPEDVDAIIDGVKAEEYDLADFRDLLITKFNFDEDLIDRIFAYLGFKGKDRPAVFKKKLNESISEMEEVEVIIDGLGSSEKMLQFSNKLTSKFNNITKDKIISYLELKETDNKTEIKNKFNTSKSTIEQISSIIDLLKSEKSETLEEVKKKLKEKYNLGFQYIPPTLNPPFLKSINLEYIYDKKEVGKIKIYNNFKFGTISNESFTPYVLHPDKTPSFYIGFENEKVSGTSLSLYFAIKEKQYGEVSGESSIITTLTDEDTGFIWKYYNGKDCNEFSVNDETRSFTIGGIVSFQVPSDIKAAAMFNKNLFWIKILPKNEKQLEFPKFKGISPNAMWAVNSTTMKNEILGSGNGIPNLSLSFPKKPILEGQVIEVNEAGILSEDEKKDIEIEEGRDAAREVKDAKTGEINEVWVRWHEVKNFALSGHLSRHYVLDRLNGKIYFGDGVRGMVPPKGKNNIVAKEYRSGGGKVGNLAPGKITVLRRKLSNIEKVNNYVSSSGGRDQENLPAAVIRGPHSLKNRNRAVTKEDYERLAREASQDVAKAKCILQPSRKINIIIVPEGSETAPFPDAGLIDIVEKYLKERALFTILDERIEVLGPEYETIDIDLSVEIARDFEGEASIIKEQIKDTLRTFLHPLKGGQNKDGWDFGQGIFISEVAAVVEAMEGVDYITNITLKKKEKDPKYLLDWTNFQKQNDSEKIREFLRDDLDVNWAINAEVELLTDIIHISKGEKSVEIGPIETDENNNKSARISISDGRKYTLKFDKDGTWIEATGVGYLPLRKIALPGAGEMNVNKE